MGLRMSQIFPALVFTSEHPHYSLALFSYLICTCTTLIYIQKDPGLLSQGFPKYANVAEMVKKMSVASLFHHEGCSKQAGRPLNRLRPNSDQHQFSPYVTKRNGYEN